MDLSYIINELGEDNSQYFNAVAPPIIQTSNFSFPTVEAMRKGFQDEMHGYLYSRGVNPTVDILRKKLAALDGAEDCLVFNSGVAAIFAGVLANVKSGDHIISIDHPYSWVQHLFNKILPRFGITTTYISGVDIENFEKALQPNTSFIYIESPSNWFLDLQDIEAVAKLAKSKAIITMIDNTYCSPLYQRPYELGIDLCMQTATKYISGHSDTLGGVLTGSAVMMRKIFESEYLCVGSGIQPHNAWLLLRGLRTMPLRLERIAKTTKDVFKFLKSNSNVEEVLFPMDPDFPQFELAKKQMKDAMGLISIFVKFDTVKQIEHFCNTLKHFRMAVSWGGHESLVIPRLAVMKPEDFDASQKIHRMIRIYVGLEDSDYLINDLKQAFDSAAALG
ncbi:MAG: trans-sulfuration enzyme family protein [Chitinophagaceae bacterium]